jgi:mono/diheme cytochrome c family protein
MVMLISVNKIKAVTIALGFALVLASVLAAGYKAAGAPSDAAATFVEKCASCHGKNGSGETGAGKALKVRDLRSADVQRQSDAQLTAIVGNGKGKMPGYEKTLGGDAVNGLVAYVRSLKK